MNEGIESTAHDNVGRGKWDLITRLIGPIDLHYHFRSKPLLRFFTRKNRNARPKILEFGCGAGHNLLELKSRLPSMAAVGVDIDAHALDLARRAAALKNYGDIRFVCAGTADVLIDETASFDYALLIDVLEHLYDPHALLAQVGKLLKPDGAVLVSVPTHRYPRVFGLEFHRSVGHVRDGFSLNELDALLGPAYERTEFNYNTGLFASMACACFYRWVPKIPFRWLAILSMISLHAFRVVDVCNGASLSCSIWAVYKRPSSPKIAVDNR